MKNYILLLALAVSFTFAGCSNLPENQAHLKIKISQKDYLLEVAKNQEQKEIGLMNRTSLPDNSGMIFYFNKPQKLSFWMKNTLVPLQIIFINGCKIVDIQEMSKEADPTNPTKSYVSNQEADKAIELNPGELPRNMIGQEVKDLCSD